MSDFREKAKDKIDAAANVATKEDEGGRQKA
jgi:hypothetical protein